MLQIIGRPQSPNLQASQTHSQYANTSPRSDLLPLVSDLRQARASQGGGDKNLVLSVNASKSGVQTARDHVFEKIAFEQNESITTRRGDGVLNGIENLAGRQEHSGLTSDPNAGVQRGNEYFKLFGTVLGSEIPLNYR